MFICKTKGLRVWQDSSTSEKRFVKWIKRSFNYLNTVVESQIRYSIDRDWPNVPKESVNGDSIMQKIENLSENWNDYWERCTAEVVVILNEGLEQTCKLAKKESRKASFKCFKDPYRDINNEYIEKVASIWDFVSAEIPLEGEDNESERLVTDTSIKPESEGQCNSDAMKWMVSFLEYLTNICATKSVVNTLSSFHDSWPIIPPNLQTVIGPLATKLKLNWKNFIWKSFLKEEDLSLLNWIDILYDSTKSSKGSKKAKKFQELQVYIMMKNSPTANAWKRFCQTLLQWTHCRVVTQTVEPTNIPNWPDVTEEPYNSQLNKIISVLNEKRETSDPENFRTVKDHSYLKNIKFKAETMDIVAKFLRSDTECKDIEPPASIHECQEEDQKSKLQWFVEIKQRLQDLGRKETKETKTSRKRIQELELDREELLNRLSKLAGAKLKDNNPNITDLSDPNRPMKIIEHFNEIYDKEWTSSLETLCNECKMEENAAIKKLLETVKDCYNFCVSTADNNIASFLMCRTSDIQKLQNTYFKNGEMHQLHEMRKAISEYCSQRVQKDYFIEKKWRKKEAETVLSEDGCEEEKGKHKAATYGNYNKRQDHLSNYTCKCLEICWYMAIQSPPVYLDFSYKKGNSFNKSVLKHYTRNGKIIDFLVWPATYLEKGGALLGKGVAQPETKASA